MQKVLYASEQYTELDEYITGHNIKKVFLVCDKSLEFLRLNAYFNEVADRLGISVIKFDEFNPNPEYESVVKGVELFLNEKCEAIIAVGGGSAIDVAKCIKLYSNMNHETNYLKQEIVPNDIEFLAVPTTAGTGSEATRYAVIYYEGEKQSISDYSCIPKTVLFDASVLKTLPEYQKKSTMLDALCHAIESYWSVNSTDESRNYSRTAIEKIMCYKDLYIANDETGNSAMLEAANIAGKAINITQTTAGHAMCYKLTSMFGIAHGHAAALCVAKLFPYMIDNTALCVDTRGGDYLKDIFEKISEAMGCDSPKNAVIKFQGLLDEMNMKVPVATLEQCEKLSNSVNVVRLKNHPIALDEAVIYDLYRKILNV